MCHPHVQHSTSCPSIRSQEVELRLAYARLRHKYSALKRRCREEHGNSRVDGENACDRSDCRRHESPRKPTAMSPRSPIRDAPEHRYPPGLQTDDAYRPFHTCPARLLSDSNIGPPCALVKWERKQSSATQRHSRSWRQATMQRSIKFSSSFHIRYITAERSFRRTHATTMHSDR